MSTLATLADQLPDEWAATDEVATAAAYLLGPDAGSITGADLLTDCGVIAALRAGRLQSGLR